MSSRRDGNVEVSSPSTRWFLISTILLALLLRLFQLGRNSFWADEAASVAFAQMPWRNFWHLLTSTEANMGLYYLLLRGWVLISDHGWFIRLLSVLAGVATIPVVYLIGKQAFSRRTGLYASVLLAVSAFHIDFSREARSYSLVAFLVCCSCLFFLRSLEERPEASGLWHVLTSAAALYAHFFAALALIAQAVSLLFIFLRTKGTTGVPPRPGHRQIANLLIVAALASPLILFILFRNHGQLDWVQPATGKDVYHFFTYLTGSGLRFIIAVLLLAWATITWTIRRPIRGNETWAFVLIALWTFLPILITLAASHWRPLFVPRFLLICLPPCLLLIAYGLAEIPQAWLRHLTFAILIFSSLWGLRSFYRKPPLEDWKQVTRLVASNSQPDDVVLFPDAYCRIPFDYDLRESRLHFDVPELAYPDGEPVLPQISASAGGIWVISCNSTKAVPPDPAPQLSASGFDRVRQKQFSGISVTEFVRK